MKRAQSLLAWSGLALMLLGGEAATVSAEAGGTKAKLWEIDDATSAGKASVAGSPARVYAVATDYANWRSVFSDVKKVELLEGGREDGLVEFKSRALEHTVTVRFANKPNALVAFELIEGPPGAAATGRYVLTAEADGTTTVSAQLTMKLTGLTGLFVSDERIRKMRRRKLRADLEDLAAHFARTETAQR